MDCCLKKIIDVIIKFYVTGYEKSPGLVKYLENKEFLGKMIQTKVVEFKKIYLLICLILDGIAKVRSRSTYKDLYCSVLKNS